MSNIGHDQLWKDIIEEFFEDFLLFFAKDLYQHVDFTKGYEFLEKELAKLFHDAESRNRHVDKLVKVYLKNGDEKWVLVHIEIQGYEEKSFAARMFQYFYRVYDKYQKEIFTIAIFSDDNEKYKPEKFDYSFFGTELTYKYNTYKILNQNEEILKESDNPFSMVILAALYSIKGKKNVDLMFGFKLNLVRLLLEEKWNREKINRLFLFIDTIMALPEELDLKFKYELEDLIRKGDASMALTWENSPTYRLILKEKQAEAEEKGLEKGRKEELIKMAYNLLVKKLKLDILPNELIQKINSAEADKLRIIRDNIFEIESLEDAVKYLE